MTIQDFGSIGELITALATLAYLALQIRQNKAVGRATGTSAHLSVLNDFSLVLVQDPELHQLYFGGLADPTTIDPKLNVMLQAAVQLKDSTEWPSETFSRETPQLWDRPDPHPEKPPRISG